MTGKHSSAGGNGTTASHNVADTLVQDILNGNYAPGERLPTERELAQEFRVSRHVVREALKRLDALRLVEIRQGSGIYAADVHYVGGMELLNHMLGDGKGSLDQEFVRDFFEFRAHIVRETVRLAALRRTDEELQVLRDALEVRTEAVKDKVGVEDINRLMFGIIAQASHNRVYQLIFNTMGNIYTTVSRKMGLLLPDEERLTEVLKRLVEAVADRDADMAELLAARLAKMHTALAEPFFEETLRMGCPDNEDSQ